MEPAEGRRIFLFVRQCPDVTRLMSHVVTDILLSCPKSLIQFFEFSKLNICVDKGACV